MTEKNYLTILEALANEIKNKESENILLKYRVENLENKIKALEENNNESVQD